MEALPKTFSSVQALRGLAALAVVLYHAVLGVHENGLGNLPDFKGGEAGVDLFFAISGFVMVTSMTRDGRTIAWSSFLLRRLVRIAPLYWIFTAIKILGIMLLPGVIRHSVLDWRLILASFLFIPCWNEGHGGVFPLLPVGWTLCFEMFFYLLLAMSLAAGRHPVRLAMGLLFFLASLSFFRTPAWGAPATLVNLILLEFVFGMVIALAVQNGRLFPAGIALVVVAGMIPLIAIYPHPFTSLIASVSPDDKDYYRAFLRGIPCALLLYALVSLERPARRRLAGLPGWIGDASYSIYLSHAFVVLPLAHLWLKFAGTGTLSAYGFVAVCVAVCTAIGIAIHRLLERPLLHHLNRKVHQPDPVGIRVPA